MNWYLSKIVFQIICGNGNHTPQFDEQLRLIAASDPGEAFYKSQKLGQKEEDSFFNQNQQMVQWKFINVSNIYKLSELIDGAELYSRIEERDNADVYINTINQKAGGIIQSDSFQLLQLV